MEIEIHRCSGVVTENQNRTVFSLSEVLFNFKNYITQLTLKKEFCVFKG